MVIYEFHKTRNFFSYEILNKNRAPLCVCLRLNRTLDWYIRIALLQVSGPFGNNRDDKYTVL